MTGWSSGCTGEVRNDTTAKSIPKKAQPTCSMSDTDAEGVTKRLVNVNRYIYGKVYFPVRSNGLKDIGHFIGAKWTSPHASGLQSLVWRHHWENICNYSAPLPIS